MTPEVPSGDPLPPDPAAPPPAAPDPGPEVPPAAGGPGGEPGAPPAGDAEPGATDPSPDFARVLDEFEERTDPGATPRKPRRRGRRPRGEARPGARVQGKVMAIQDDVALVEFGGRSEGSVEMKHYRDESGAPRIAAGDVLDLFVVEAGEQVRLAPSIKPEAQAALGQIRAARASGMPVRGKVTGVNSGGLIVDLGGVRGFCPLSQIEAGFCADPSVHVGASMEFLVTRIEEGRGSAVLSRRAVLRRSEAEKARELVASIRPGEEREGRVARLEPFGAFVNLGGVDGLVHVSQIRRERIQHPREALRVGETVRVRVVSVEPGKDGKMRISLSMKALEEPAADGAPPPPPRARGGRGPARRTAPAKAAPAAPGPPGPAAAEGRSEPTTMAIALRKAMEEARRRGQGKE